MIRGAQLHFGKVLFQKCKYLSQNFEIITIASFLFVSDEAIRQSRMPTSRNSMEMENHVFQKAKSKEEYLSFVARLILHVREMSK